MNARLLVGAFLGSVFVAQATWGVATSVEYVMSFLWKSLPATPRTCALALPGSGASTSRLRIADRDCFIGLV